MERPEVSIQSDRSEAVRRRADAIRSGVVVTVGDTPFLVSAADEKRARALAELIHGLPATESTPVCTLAYAAGDGAVPSRAPDDGLPDGDVWQHDSEFAFRHHSGLVARADETSVLVEGAVGAPRVLRRLLHPAITHVLAHHERYALHGAAVANADGAVLILGGSGMGKSTTALAALEAGWEVLADDMVVVVPRARGEYELVGLPRPMAVPRDVVRDAAGLATIERDERSRVEISPDRLSAAPHRLRAVLVSDHADQGSTTLEPMSQATVIGDVLGAFTATRNEVLRRAFFDHALGLSLHPSGRIRHGANARDRLSGAVSALEQVAVLTRPAST